MKKPVTYHALRNTAGFGLIEVLITVAILVFISLGMAGSLSDMHTQLRGINQKQEVIELRNLLTQQMAKAGVCSWQLKDKVINVSMATSEASPSPTILDLGELRMGQDAASPLLAKSGQRIPETQAGVKVSKVHFRNIYSTGNPNEYKGLFHISFDTSSLVVPVKPLQVQQIFMTNPTDPPNAKRIQTCKGGGGTVKAQCATAMKRGKYPGGSMIIHNFSSAPAFSDVFAVYEYPGGGSAWGLACKSDYMQTTCSGSELNQDTTMGPDLWQYQYGKQGCFSDDEELNGADPTVYLTCCQFATE